MTETGRPIAEVECGIVAHDWVNDSYKHLIADAPATALAARPGQFFHILCPADSADSPYLRRPMSVYRVDREAARVPCERPLAESPGAVAEDPPDPLQIEGLQAGKFADVIRGRCDIGQGVGERAVQIE